MRMPSSRALSWSVGPTSPGPRPGPTCPEGEAAPEPGLPSPGRPPAVARPPDLGFRKKKKALDVLVSSDFEKEMKFTIYEARQRLHHDTYTKLGKQNLFM